MKIDSHLGLQDHPRKQAAIFFLQGHPRKQAAILSCKAIQETPLMFPNSCEFLRPFPLIEFSLFISRISHHDGSHMSFKVNEPGSHIGLQGYSDKENINDVSKLLLQTGSHSYSISSSSSFYESGIIMASRYLSR